MSFERVGGMLRKSLQQAGIETQVTGVQVLSEVTRLIEARWGKEKAAYLQAQSFANGVLVIRALAPAAVQEAKMTSIEWQNAINHRLGGKRIHELRIVT